MGWGSSEPELLQSLRMTGLTGQSLQLSVLEIPQYLQLELQRYLQKTPGSSFMTA